MNKINAKQLFGRILPLVILLSGLAVTINDTSSVKANTASVARLSGQPGGNLDWPPCSQCYDDYDEALAYCVAQCGEENEVCINNCMRRPEEQFIYCITHCY